MAVRGKEIPTIDVEMVTIQVEGSENELGLYTASQIQVSPQVETIEAVKLVVKNRLIAQKRKQEMITGHEITLTDNVFNVQLVEILQGGEIIKDVNGKITGYNPPLTGSGELGKVFSLNAYSTIYDASGLIQGYEKIVYPHCTGNPVTLNSQDGTFRAPEYTITSAPNKNEPAYRIEYVEMLPNLEDYKDGDEETVTPPEAEGETE